MKADMLPLSYGELNGSLFAFSATEHEDLLIQAPHWQGFFSSWGVLCYKSVIHQKERVLGETVFHSLTCSPIQQQSVRIRSSIAAERGIFSEIQSDFKDVGRSAENSRWEMKAGGDRERQSWEVNIPHMTYPAYHPMIEQQAHQCKYAQLLQVFSYLIF